MFPGEAQFDLPIGIALSQSRVREPSGTQAAKGCQGEELVNLN